MLYTLSKGLHKISRRARAVPRPPLSCLRPLRSPPQPAYMHTQGMLTGNQPTNQRQRQPCTLPPSSYAALSSPPQKWHSISILIRSMFWAVFTDKRRRVAPNAPRTAPRAATGACRKYIQAVFLAGAALRALNITSWLSWIPYTTPPLPLLPPLRAPPPPPPPGTGPPGGSSSGSSSGEGEFGGASLVFSDGRFWYGGRAGGSDRPRIIGGVTVVSAKEGWGSDQGAEKEWE